MSQATNTQPTKRYLQVNGKRMAYVEMGTGDPIVLQHGNPTSSYLWRNIMPALSGYGRCIAVDLIGMGDSEKLADSGPDRYSFAEHSRYLDAAWDALGITGNVTLVLHDWGSALGFDWANRHRDAVKRIAYMEGFVKPLRWSDWPDALKPAFTALRSEAGEQMVLNDNVFVESILPGAILRKLDEAEMNEYRRPFAEPGESRRPTLTWPRQIPFDGSPEDVAQRIEAYSRWMAGNDIPKLFINAEPGAILVGEPRAFCRTWKNQREVTVAGIHFIQEDSPGQIARALSDWLA
ncbi:MAG: haloalkane dehalogenase [Nevskiales bacterium]|nr:haloalkane dehalogenase [Nevskiales bacterium]